MNLKELNKIELEIDNLLLKYDNAMKEMNYELSINLIDKITLELEKLEKNEIKLRLN